MNPIIETMIEQMNVRQPNEPCGYVTLAKNLRTSGNTLYMSVHGDRFTGVVGAQYNEGTDLYDIAFYSRKGALVESIEGLDFEQLPAVLWNKTYIV